MCNPRLRTGCAYSIVPRKGQWAPALQYTTPSSSSEDISMPRAEGLGCLSSLFLGPEGTCHLSCLGSGSFH